jgi:flagellar biosynthetic protein FlhB
MQTKQELKQESKEQDGNPEIKQRIRQIQKEMSRKRMIKDVKTADVIITNPTHISIVVKYNSENMVSPMVVGKGADHLAMKIREIAKEHNIPIVENVLLARTLYKTVKVGAPVPRTLYKAVAEVLAFVYKLKKKEKLREKALA